MYFRDTTTPIKNVINNIIKAVQYYGSLLLSVLHLSGFDIGYNIIYISSNVKKIHIYINALSLLIFSFRLESL